MVEEGTGKPTPNTNEASALQQLNINAIITLQAITLVNKVEAIWD